MSRKSTALYDVPISDETAPESAPRFEPALPIAHLLESPNNPRKTFDRVALEELASSVREKGVLTPLIVRQLPKGESYEIAAGHRRFRAAKMAGFGSVPAIVRDMSDQEFLEVLVIENDQREDVHPLEEAAGYQQLLERPGYDVMRLAAKVGRSAKYVYDRVKLLQLTPKAQQLFLENRFTAGHAILLARLPREMQQQAVEVDGAEEGYGDPPPLFSHELSLFSDGEDDEQPAGNPYDEFKPVSVRQLQSWIDRTVKVDREAVDPMLFPETAAFLEEAKAEGKKVIPIMRLNQTPEAARGDERIYSETSWKRADGREGSKSCPHAEPGIVSIGPGRYEAFDMCRKKDRCRVHWAADIKAREQREQAAAKAKMSGKDPVQARKETYAEQDRNRREREAREEADRARWVKARAAILEELAAAVRKAPTKATGLLGDLVLRGMESYTARSRDVEKLVPRGRTAEDLVRHAAMIVVASQASRNGYRAEEELVPMAKAFGIDARKVRDEVAPAPKVQTSAKAGKPVRGTCRKCACTEENACASGCGWADKTETRCTACFPPKVTGRAKKKARR